MAQCNRCQTTDEDLNYFWHGDIEEDYDMGDYDSYVRIVLVNLTL